MRAPFQNYFSFCVVSRGLAQNISISKSVQILLLLFLIFGGLYFAREFLIPLTFGGLLATLILPFSRRLERKGIHKGIAIVMCLLGLLLIAGGILALIVWQVSDLATDVSEMQQQISGLIGKIRDFLSTAIGISGEKQKEIIEQQQQSSGVVQMASMVTGTMGVLVDFVLVTVYAFLFIYFRHRLKKFILMLVPAEEIDRTEKVISQSAKVAYQYLSGLSMMIVMLWIFYSIGFSIAGLKSAVFFAILCGILEIVPFVGNLTGTGIAVLMAVSQGEGSGLIFGVLGTYLFVQFIQSYILEPLVVGAEVNINPLFTIVVLVLGESLWGIAGMILAIPLLGITKILFDNIESLKPYAYLIGGDSKQRKGWGERMRKLLRGK